MVSESYLGWRAEQFAGQQKKGIPVASPQTSRALSKHIMSQFKAKVPGRTTPRARKSKGRGTHSTGLVADNKTHVKLQTGLFY